MMRYGQPVTYALIFLACGWYATPAASQCSDRPTLCASYAYPAEELAPIEGCPLDLPYFDLSFCWASKGGRLGDDRNCIIHSISNYNQDTPLEFNWGDSLISETSLYPGCTIERHAARFASLDADKAVLKVGYSERRVHTDLHRFYDSERSSYQLTTAEQKMLEEGQRIEVSTEITSTTILDNEPIPIGVKLASGVTPAGGSYLYDYTLEWTGLQAAFNVQWLSPTGALGEPVESEGEALQTKYETSGEYDTAPVVVNDLLVIRDSDGVVHLRTIAAAFVPR